MPTKEEIYDQQINPLMAQIIEICKEHKISNICTFSLDRDDDLLCTTAMVAEEFESPDVFAIVLRFLRISGEDQA